MVEDDEGGDKKGGEGEVGGGTAISRICIKEGDSGLH